MMASLHLDCPPQRASAAQGCVCRPANLAPHQHSGRLGRTGVASTTIAFPDAPSCPSRTHRDSLQFQGCFFSLRCPVRQPPYLHLHALARRLGRHRPGTEPHGRSTSQTQRPKESPCRRHGPLCFSALTMSSSAFCFCRPPKRPLPGTGRPCSRRPSIDGSAACQCPWLTEHLPSTVSRWRCAHRHQRQMQTLEPTRRHLQKTRSSLLHASDSGAAAPSHTASSHETPSGVVH